MYIRRNPDVIDKGLAMVAKEQFHLCTSFEERKRIFLSIPEPEIPMDVFEAQILDKINNYYMNAESNLNYSNERYLFI